MMAANNRSLTLSDSEIAAYQKRCLRLDTPVTLAVITDRTIHQDTLEAVHWLPDTFVDLLILDPPYNVTKSFNGTTFKRTPLHTYTAWAESCFTPLLRLLKPTASVYICSDWRSSTAIYTVASRYLIVRNRITWEREKGRGAKTNWKDCIEDVWFCTVSDNYTFNLDDVKQKRRVIAPYTVDGKPKDWYRTPAGNFRETYPSNIWTDITVPFWSMPENTPHPTQKPEKLIAKLILASSNRDDLVLDPFLGSGTTSVVAKKLGRHYVGIERELEFCCLTEKRLGLADSKLSIQGYEDGVFWERNSAPAHTRKANAQQQTLLR